MSLAVPAHTHSRDEAVFRNPHAVGEREELGPGRDQVGSASRGGNDAAVRNHRQTIAARRKRHAVNLKKKVFR